MELSIDVSDKGREEEEIDDEEEATF